MSRSLFSERRAADSRVMTRDQAQQLVERVVKTSKADSIQVNVGGGYTANVRFADNRISTAGGVTTATVNVSSAFGPKHAVTSTNDFSDEGLERAVRQSESLAKLAPDDPESMPPLGPQKYEDNIAYFDSTGGLGPDGRAEAARVAIDACKKVGDLKAAGFLVTGIGAGAVGNSAGLFAYQSSTSSNYTLTVRTADGTGSGWAGADHPDWTQIDVQAVAQTAIDKALLSRTPVAVEPGRYTVILEPQAVGDLVQLLAFSFDARSADEGRSPYSKAGGGNKLGEKIADERVTLLSDPADPQLLTNTFDGQGLPAHRQVWIENGILRKLTYGRFWAQKKGVTPDAGTNAVKFVGGTQSTEDLIKSTPRGILVTRLFYLRPVDPRTVLYTGLTRDGTFLIENGKISKAAKNFRFNESPLFMLNNLEGL
ncbi:MAG: TldD/PmbA family protein, partial [Gemmatimonadaceae bacterium]